MRRAGEGGGLEGRDTDIARVPAVELHDIVEIRAERREHFTDLRHHLPGLGHDVARMEHPPGRVDRRLSGHEDHLAAAHALAEGIG